MEERGKREGEKWKEGRGGNNEVEKKEGRRRVRERRKRKKEKAKDKNKDPSEVLGILIAYHCSKHLGLKFKGQIDRESLMNCSAHGN